jgi:hypothetical protein
MALQSDTTGAAPTVVSEDSESSRMYSEGIAAGVIGAATIAIWFFILDLYHGRPFYTPNVLGAMLFRSATISDLSTLPISLKMILYYTWVHGLVFCVIGGLASKLLSIAERDVNCGFGILLLFVVFEFGFVAAAMVFAQPILRTLALPAVLVGNLLAASAMAVYFWRHHPKLWIAP